MKINRLIEMVTILLNRKKVSAKELADRFDVSIRTIYRDIDVLSSAGVPVYTNKGNGGGISLLEDYTLDKTLLSQGERENLIVALKAISATGYPETDVIIDKIGSIFKISHADDWIEVNLEGWSSKVNEQNKFSKIKDAIINYKVIRFDYINGNGGKSNRFAEPIKLIFNVYTWYLIAYCKKRNSQCMFRFSRIKNVQVMDQHFTKREIVEYENQDLHESTIQLKLRCHEKVLNRLYDTFDEEFISKNENGSYDLFVPVREDEWLYGYILSLGGFAEILEPKHIRVIIKNRAKEILGNY